MRRSLLVRLLALSLSVAVCAVVATAFLATRSTTQQIRSEFDRSLEADAFVYSTLLDWALAHRDWSGVEDLVDELAARTGRRVALTDDGGDLIADALPVGDDRGQDGDPVPLPDSVAAVIDPFAPLTGEPIATLGSPPVEASGVPRPGRDLVDRIMDSDPELRRLRETAEQAAVTCLSEAGYPVPPRDTDADRRFLTVSEETPYEIAEDCGAFSLNHPTDVEEELLRSLEEATSACGPYEEGVDLAPPSPPDPPRPVDDEELRAEDGDVRLDLGPDDGEGIGTDDDGLAADDGLDPDGGRPVGDLLGDVDATCVREATRSVLGDRVAQPALLYLESPVPPAGLAAAGRTEVLTIVGLVSLLVLGVTFVAGRRLVRPVTDLTGAAQRMEAGDHAARVPVRGRDEVARLGTAFNAMAAALEATEEQRRTMVSDVAHELRSPLTTLRGHLEGVQDGIVAPDAELVASLLEEANLLQRLVDDLQQLALADAGQLRIDVAPVDAVDVANQVVATHRVAAEQAGLGLRVEAGGVDDTTVVGDVDRLRQALGNLVSNALRYTADGEVVVGVEPDSDRPDRLRVTVTDTGIGIEPGELPHVFDRFYRTDRSRSRVTGGSGLGLAITRSLVEAQGGQVTATSVPGQGSTFVLHLPRHTVT